MILEWNNSLRLHNVMWLSLPHPKVIKIPWNRAELCWKLGVWGWKTRLGGGTKWPSWMGPETCQLLCENYTSMMLVNNKFSMGKWSTGRMILEWNNSLRLHNVTWLSLPHPKVIKIPWNQAELCWKLGAWGWKTRLDRGGGAWDKGGRSNRFVSGASVGPNILQYLTTLGSQDSARLCISQWLRALYL